MTLITDTEVIEGPWDRLKRLVRRYPESTSTVVFFILLFLLLAIFG